MGALMLSAFMALTSLTVEVANFYVVQIRDQRVADIVSAGVAIAEAGHGSSATANSLAATTATNLLSLNGSTASFTTPVTSSFNTFGSGTTTKYTGQVPVSLSESRPLQLSRVLGAVIGHAGQSAMTVGASSTASFVGFPTITEASGTCGVALGSGGITVSGGSTLQSGSSASSATCSIETAGSVSASGNSTITESTITAGGSVSATGGSTINANVITQNSTPAITNFVAADSGTATQLATLATTSSIANPTTAYTAPTCTKSYGTITMNGYTVPTSGDSTNSYPFYKSAGDGTHSGYLYYLLDSPPSGSVYCYSGLVINGHTSVAFATQSGGYGTIVIGSVTTSTDANYATFPSATYYFTGAGGVVMNANANFTFYPGTYYFTGKFQDNNNAVTEYLFYDPNNPTTTGNYYFSGGLEIDSGTAYLGAGNYYANSLVTISFATVYVGGAASINGSNNTNVTNFFVGGNFAIFGTVYFNGTGNWTVNGTFLDTVGAVVYYGCRNNAVTVCYYKFNGDVDFSNGVTEYFGNDIFLASGSIGFASGNTASSTSGTGVSFFAQGTISFLNGVNANLNANTSAGNGSSAVIFGTTSTSADAILFASGVSAQLNGIIYAPNGGIVSYGGVTTTTQANSCLQYVGSSLTFGGGTSTISTCAGFTGSTATGGNTSTIGTSTTGSEAFAQVIQ